MMPVPSHLKKNLYPQSDIVDEEPLIGDVECDCGNETFRVMYPGKTQLYEGKMFPCTIEIDGNFFFLIKAICSKCCAEYVLFDKHYHGWDGFLCHDLKKATLPRPTLVDWRCLSCNGIHHQVILKISSQGKTDFIDAVGGEYDEDRWPDAFEWIWITIKCNHCGLVTEDWVDYETA